MSEVQHEVLIGSILLEVNRHRSGRTPTYRVSDWLERFREAGFDGVELWENHATAAPEEEVQALAASPLPMAIYNAYATFWDGSSGLEDSTRMAERLGARAIKFNWTRDPNRTEDDLRGVDAWQRGLPAGIRALCECHPGTIAETPAQAAALFDRLGRDRFDVLVHPFSRPESLGEWLRVFGPRVTHAHIQMRDENDLPIRLDRKPQFVRDTMRLMRDAGFQGSWTFEFTEGTNRPGENIDALWEDVLLDLAFLREALA